MTLQACSFFSSPAVSHSFSLSLVRPLSLFLSLCLALICRAVNRSCVLKWIATIASLHLLTMFHRNHSHLRWFIMTSCRYLVHGRTFITYYGLHFPFEFALITLCELSYLRNSIGTYQNHHHFHRIHHLNGTVFIMDLWIVFSKLFREISSLFLINYIANVDLIVFI